MIVARIQAHPSRTHLHQPLVDRLAPFPAEVLTHTSEPRDPWANYRRCLTDIPKDASHLVVAQDDAIPCDNFALACQKIAASNPDSPVCLFMGAFPSSTAARIRRSKPDVRYVALGPSSFMPLVCVLWPAHVARQFLAWSSVAKGMTRADDGNAARWMKATRTQVMVAVPSLVEHDDYVPSVKGGRDHVPGAEAWRRALFLAANGSDHAW